MLTSGARKMNEGQKEEKLHSRAPFWFTTVISRNSALELIQFCLTLIGGLNFKEGGLKNKGVENE